MRQYTFGYARISTEQQNLDRQIDLLKAHGVDQIYTEKMTGTRRDRPELNNMLERMTAGDTVVIESLSRLGRSTKDLIELVDLFNQGQVHLVFLKTMVFSEVEPCFFNGMTLRLAFFRAYSSYVFFFLMTGENKKR